MQPDSEKLSLLPEQPERPAVSLAKQVAEFYTTLRRAKLDPDHAYELTFLWLEGVIAGDVRA